MSQISSPQKRNRSQIIRFLETDAPFISVASAVKESGVSEKEIREKFQLRKFGNADFLRVKTFNRWIDTGETPEWH